MAANLMSKRTRRRLSWFGGVGLSLCLSGVAPATAAVATNDVRRDAAVAAIEHVNASVVNIATETIIEQRDWYEDLFRRFYGVPGRQQKSMNLGSGVIIDEEGYIVTNFHVVRRASRIQVKLWDGREFEASPRGGDRVQRCRAS